MLIRGADGRLYAITAEGLELAAYSSTSHKGAETRLGENSEDHVSSASIWEPPIPPSFP